jgi:uncharacterized protein
MNPQTQSTLINGPAGLLQCAVDAPAEPRGVVVICHPHPQHGGTQDNKVVQTLARAFVQCGYLAVRFNFRGVGQSEGTWDEGRGEVEDALAVVAAHAQPGQPLLLAGFSFGGFVAASAAQRLAGGSQPVQRLVLVGPAASRFALPAVPPGTLVLHGEADDVVPLQSVFDWARPQVLPVTVLPGVGHFFHGQLPLLKNLVVQALA